MNLQSIDLIVSDVTAATNTLVNVFDATPVVTEPEFAELTFEGFTIMLSHTAMVPMKPAQGVILHFKVDNPAEHEQRIIHNGGTILQTLTTTPWGTKSVLCQGPDGVVIDLYTLAETPTS